MKWNDTKTVLFGDGPEGGEVHLLVFFDPEKSNTGWYAQYRGAAGTVIDDSEKVWHPDMPRRRNASSAAWRIARAYARTLLTVG